VIQALAARTRDVDDLRVLAGIIEVDSAETALRICAEFFPDEQVPPRTAAVLQELFGLPRYAGWCPRRVLLGLVLRHFPCSGRSRHVERPGCGSRRAAAWRTWRKMCVSPPLISGDPGLRSTIIAFSSSCHQGGLRRLPMRSHRPVRFSSSGMPRLSPTGSTAWVQAPHSPMKTTQGLRLIGAPGVNGMTPRSPSKAGRGAA